MEGVELGHRVYIKGAIRVCFGDLGTARAGGSIRGSGMPADLVLRLITSDSSA